jgi:RND family efflux transporter MFP subunit
MSTLAIAFAAASFGCGDRSLPPPPLALATAPAPVMSAGIGAGAGARGFIGVVVVGESVEVEARVEGRIEDVLVKPGDRVARGAPLVRLDRLAAAHELTGARAARNEAQRRLGRWRRLRRIRPDAVAPEELDRARRDAIQARAEVAKLEAAQADATVRAPFDGTVAERYLVPGALAGPGRPVLRLVGAGVPRVRFAVPEDLDARARAELAPGRLVEVRVLTGRRLHGRISGLSPEVDAASRMVFAAATLEATPADAGGLSTGLVARVFLPPPAAEAHTP